MLRHVPCAHGVRLRRVSRRASLRLKCLCRVSASAHEERRPSLACARAVGAVTRGDLSGLLSGPSASPGGPAGRLFTLRPASKQTDTHSDAQSVCCVAVCSRD